MAAADGCDASAASRKTRCTNCTTVDPSPTTAAIRFVLPERTSPAAKMPGTLVAPYSEFWVSKV